ncbi:MAG: hypothetical protein IAF08_06815 [Rhizobacter sp.]|nr:hypothetical protein [Chlorobiales bacterium]
MEANSHSEQLTAALKKFQCAQCGATGYELQPGDKVKCTYCNTVYQAPTPSKEKPTMFIKKGANVVFGANSVVSVKGGIHIEDGAEVSFLGRLEIIERGDEEIIKAAAAKKSQSNT